ncbi:MAG: hypothetical protein Fur0021_07970 [Candidatus Promineifilaceae bacterium]
MAELKTKPNDQNVTAFLDSVADERKRQDCYTLLALMQEATQAEPKMWGDSIVGFGSYNYKYPTGSTGQWFLAGFAPRKQNLTLYIMSGFDEYDALMAKLGKHTTGKACLYIKRLSDVNLDALRELVQRSIAHMRQASHVQQIHV